MSTNDAPAQASVEADRIDFMFDRFPERYDSYDGGLSVHDLADLLGDVRQAVRALVRERDHWLGEARRILKSGQAAVDEIDRLRTLSPPPTVGAEDEAIVTDAMIDAGCAAWVQLYPAFKGEKPPPTAGDVVKAILTAALATRPSPSAVEVKGRLVRHKKSGGIYEVIGEAQVQTSRPLEDYEVVIVYRSLNTPDIDDPASPMKGDVWVRPKAEFEDGRFESVSCIASEGGL